MKSLWWKILGIALLLYTVIFGLTTPLKPGIISITPFQTNAGQQVEFTVKGYNTNFTDYETSAWLELDGLGLLKAKSFLPYSSDSAQVSFIIPPNFPAGDSLHLLDVIFHSDEDGAAVLPKAIVVNSHALDGSPGAMWMDTYDKVLSPKPGMQFPYRPILNETIRNTFFHVPLWFSMFILLIASLVYSVKYLIGKNMNHDIIASSLVKVSVLFGLLGIVTGSIWAKYTWGTFWTTDVKLNMATVAMLIYVASLILRSSINDIDKRARLSAAYNIFAFAALIPLVFIIPRMTDSLHPGNGGNPALGGEDMENTLRMVFYPAIIGFTLLGLWIASISIRYEFIKDRWLSRK